MYKFEETFEQLNSKYNQEYLEFTPPNETFIWRLVSVIKEKTDKYEDYRIRNYRLIWETNNE